MSWSPKPFELAWTGVRVATLMVEAQVVITYRIMGMAGIWAVSETEKRRMVTEKAPAFLESGFAATFAMMRAQSPVDVIDAALDPLTRKTRSNRKRLAKRGFQR